MNEPKLKIPKHLQTCRAVFQGGGVKVISIVGAVKKAADSGVIFSAVAGTSAGSIVAALLGAGASTEFIISSLANVDKSGFLFDPDPGNLNSKKKYSILKILKNLPIGFLGKLIANGIIYGGNHSSKGIENWIDLLLSSLLKDCERPIKFRDLKKPTFIVASDISSAKIKEWSTTRTPDDSVAFAVRASCSIPFFFQPVAKGVERYVDGGLLSNLPEFIFQDVEELSHDPTLVFSLSEKYDPPEDWTTMEYAKRLFSTLVDGATKLQGMFASNNYIINIDATGIGTVDFDILSDKKKQSILLSRGEDSFQNFIKSYHSLHRSRNYKNNYNIFRDESEMLSWLVSECESSVQSLIIGSSDTRWFWRTFPTILNLMRKRVSISVVCNKAQGSPTQIAQEGQRREGMNKFGIHVAESNEVPFLGYYLYGGSSNNRAIICSPEQSLSEIYATYYKGSRDRSILDLLWQRLSTFNSVSLPKEITLERVAEDYFIESLKKHVPQYYSDQCHISFQKLDVENVRILNKYLRASKYKQIEFIFDAYNQSGIDLFEPAAIKSNNEFVSYITPPVVEKIGNQYVVIEGNTRFYYAWRNEINSIGCFVVEGVSQSLPGEPTDFDCCIVDSKERVGNERIKGFNYDNFRPIERAIRPL